MKRHRKSTGYADTKRVPLKQHPSKYWRLGNDNIEFITFTHHPSVTIKGKNVNTVPLTKNINPKEAGDSKSYIYPIKYRGRRSALGRERHDLSLNPEDSKIVNEVRHLLPTEKIKKTSNSKKK